MSEYRIEQAQVWRVVDESGKVAWSGVYDEPYPLIGETREEAEGMLERLLEQHKRRVEEITREREARAVPVVPADIRVEVVEGKAVYVADVKEA